MQLIVSQCVESLDAFVNQVETQLMDIFRTRLENVYAGSQLAFSYMSTYVSDVGAGGVEVQSRTFPSEQGEDAADTIPPAPVPLKPSTPSRKGLVVVPERLTDSYIHCLKLVSHYY